MNPAFLAWWLDDGDRISDPMELARAAFEAGRRAQRNEYEMSKMQIRNQRRLLLAQVRSKAKAAASRRNGKKGGRPRKKKEAK